jgi:hypothetical protein
LGAVLVSGEGYVIDCAAAAIPEPLTLTMTDGVRLQFRRSDIITMVRRWVKMNIYYKLQKILKQCTFLFDFRLTTINVILLSWDQMIHCGCSALTC